jgi:asparagine synthase (glutamine-hydrolysing)
MRGPCGPVANRAVCGILGTYDIDGLTISFRPEDWRLEAMLDELAYAGKQAGHHGITLYEDEIAPDVADVLPRMVHTLDEPIGDAGAINAYLVCRAARHAEVKVLLSRMGADEMFGGLSQALGRARRRPLPPPARRPAPPGRRAGGRALPVAGRRRGYRASRWAERFVALATSAEERRSTRATPTTASTSCTRRSTPSSGRGSTSWSASTRPSTTRARPTTR